MKNLYDINDWTNIKEHQKLGEILIASGKINLIQLSMAIDMQRFKNIKIGTILQEMHILTQNDLNEALKIQMSIDRIIQKDKNRNDI